MSFRPSSALNVPGKREQGLTGQSHKTVRVLSANLVVHIARGEVLHVREESLHVGSRQIHLQPEEHGGDHVEVT